MLVTREVSQPLMSALNFGLLLKAFCIFVTRLTSQFGMVPYFFVVNPYVVHKPSAGDSDKQPVIAALIVESVKQ